MRASEFRISRNRASIFLKASDSASSLVLSALRARTHSRALAPVTFSSHRYGSVGGGAAARDGVESTVVRAKTASKRLMVDLLVSAGSSGPTETRHHSAGARDRPPGPASGPESVHAELLVFLELELRARLPSVTLHAGVRRH